MIDAEQEKKLYRVAMETWGVDAQRLMLIEECSELIKAMCDRLRGREKVDIYIMDEMADVKIMLGQIELLVDAEELEQIRQAKLERLKKRLEKHVGPIEL